MAVFAFHLSRPGSVLKWSWPQILINDRHSYVGEFIILVIETVAILFAMRLKRKGFQYFFITVLIAGVFADFTLQFD